MFYNMLPATGREFCIKIFNCLCCLINLSALPEGPSTVSTAASACQLCLEDLQLSLLPHQPVSCLENLQLQISRVIRVIIKELLNRGAGFGRRVTGKSS